MAQEALQLDPEEFFRTNDMAMATYLKLQGFPVQVIEWKSGTCYWIFRVSDFMLDELEKFQEGRAMVEPREYNRIYARSKREFYDARPGDAGRPVAAADG